MSSTGFFTQQGKVSNKLSRHFDFGYERQQDFVMPDGKRSYFDPVLGRYTRHDALLAGKSDFQTVPYYQEVDTRDKGFQFCGTYAPMPRKDKIASLNYNKPMWGIPPVLFDNRYKIADRPDTYILDPQSAPSYENIERVQNYDAKFRQAKPPIQELERQFLEQQTNKFNNSDFARDRDSLIRALKSAGAFTDADAQKPTAELIKRANSLSDDNNPQFGDPHMQQILGRLQSQVNEIPQNNRQQLERIRAVNNANSVQATGVGQTGNQAQTIQSGVLMRTPSQPTQESFEGASPPPTTVEQTEAKPISSRSPRTPVRGATPQRSESTPPPQKSVFGRLGDLLTGSHRSDVDRQRQEPSGSMESSGAGAGSSPLQRQDSIEDQRQEIKRRQGVESPLRRQASSESGSGEAVVGEAVGESESVAETEETGDPSTLEKYRSSIDDKQYLVNPKTGGIKTESGGSNLGKNASKIRKDVLEQFLRDNPMEVSSVDKLPKPFQKKLKEQNITKTQANELLGIMVD